jgi:hypothetical protein
LRKKLTIGGVVAIAALGAATLAYAVVGVALSASVTGKAGKPAGIKVHIASSDPAAPQPPIMDRITLKLQSGGKFNGKKFPKCNANTLLSKGPSGCPKGSKIGTGKGVGYAKPVVTDPVNAKLTLFNGGSVINVFVLPDLGPTFITPCKVSSSYTTIDCTVPPIKTLPSAPDAAVGTVDTTTPVLKLKKLALIVAPKKCKGTWKMSGTFHFTTGQSVTTPFSQKCKK